MLAVVSWTLLQLSPSTKTNRMQTMLHHSPGAWSLKVGGLHWAPLSGQERMERKPVGSGQAFLGVFLEGYLYRHSVPAWAQALLSGLTQTKPERPEVCLFWCRCVSSSLKILCSSIFACLGNGSRSFIHIPTTSLRPRPTERDYCFHIQPKCMQRLLSTPAMLLQ